MAMGILRPTRTAPPLALPSNVTGLLLTSILVVRERIPLPNDNKHILTFKKVYDRLFKEFKEKLV
jgi:hypothetical protein